MKTVVALYDTKIKADQVKNALMNDGFEGSRISVMGQEKQTYAGSYSGEPVHESLGERIKHFFGVFGEGEHSGHEAYTSGVERGGAIIAVKAEDDDARKAADLLHSYGAQEVSDRYTQGPDPGAKANDTGNGHTAANDGAIAKDRVIPVVQEEFEVGKRQVNRGGVRVYSHMVDTPVSKNISLHDERVVVERRPVDRVATSADFRIGTAVVELTAMGEEAVVGKRSRVVEEVSVGKVGSDRIGHRKSTIPFAIPNSRWNRSRPTGTLKSREDGVLRQSI